MNVIVLGAGRRGLRLARHLIQEKKSVIFIDNNSERCAQAQKKLDCMAICGSATDVSVLEEAGAKDADVFVAVTGSDEVNLVACGIAATNFPNAKTIAAIRGISYLGKNTNNKRILGIDHIVNPEEEAAKRIFGILQSGLFSDVISFDDADFILFRAKVESGSMFEGQTLIGVKKSLKGNYVIIGVKRGHDTFTPSGETKLEAGDEVAVVVAEDEMEDLFRAFHGNFSETRLRRIIVVGGTGIARFLFGSLNKRMARRITLVEKDPAVCKDFSDEFPQILVLNDSVTEEELWEDERIGASDLFISLTENDELNIIAASYAKKIGTKHSIALLKTNPNYIQFVSNMDIDVAISTTESTVDAIMTHMRGDSVKTLHSIFDGDLEVYEFVLTHKFAKLGAKLMEVDLRGKCIISGVKRSKSESFVPNGMYEFTEGDTVLVACVHENYDFVTEFFK